MPKDWKKRAASVEPRASLPVKLQLNGKEHSFLNVSTVVGSTGIAEFVSDPKLAINILCPADDTLDLQRFFDPAAKHPLLFY